jgi:hypothetical protein
MITFGQGDLVELFAWVMEIYFGRQLILEILFERGNLVVLS